MLILLFDGQCILCNGWVKFIISKDTKQKFKFATLQSKFGSQILKKNGLNANYMDSLVLLDEDLLYVSSTAALQAIASLEGNFRFLKFLLLIPHSIREPIYQLIAKYRYKWFGKRESCMIPSAEIKNRFISDD